MSAQARDWSVLFEEREFNLRLDELNEVISRSGEVIEGNIFFQNSESLLGVKVDAEHAAHRKGFAIAVLGRSRFLEIGFNAGHSALVYLLQNPEGIYYGIDLASRRYTAEAISYMSQTFGRRFNLTIGNSMDVLPRMRSEQVAKFDAIHVDGGHTFEVAFSDIMNSVRLLEDDGLLIVDDRPAPDVRRAIDMSLSTTLLEPHELDAEFASGFQSYLRKSL